MHVPLAHMWSVFKFPVAYLNENSATRKKKHGLCQRRLDYLHGELDYKTHEYLDIGCTEKVSEIITLSTPHTQPVSIAMHLFAVATKALPLLLWASVSSADATIRCYDYSNEFNDSWSCINQLFWTMRQDLVENSVWWPNGFSNYWTWSCSDNKQGCTDTYGGYVYAKNNHQDVQNAWDGLVSYTAAS